MECGRLVLAGATAEVMGRYRGINAMSCELDFSKNSVKAGSKVRLLKARLADAEGFSKCEFDLTEPLSFIWNMKSLKIFEVLQYRNFHLLTRRDNTSALTICLTFSMERKVIIL